MLSRRSSIDEDEKPTQLSPLETRAEASLAAEEAHSGEDGDDEDTGDVEDDDDDDDEDSEVEEARRLTHRRLAVQDEGLTRVARQVTLPTHCKICTASLADASTEDLWFCPVINCHCPVHNICWHIWSTGCVADTFIAVGGKKYRHVHCVHCRAELWPYRFTKHCTLLRNGVERDDEGKGYLRWRYLEEYSSGVSVCSPSPTRSPRLVNGVVVPNVVNVVDGVYIVGDPNDIHGVVNVDGVYVVGDVKKDNSVYDPARASNAVGFHYVNYVNRVTGTNGIDGVDGASNANVVSVATADQHGESRSRYHSEADASDIHGVNGVNGVNGVDADDGLAIEILSNAPTLVDHDDNQSSGFELDGSSRDGNYTVMNENDARSVNGVNDVNVVPSDGGPTIEYLNDSGPPVDHDINQTNGVELDESSHDGSRAGTNGAGVDGINGIHSVNGANADNDPGGEDSDHMQSLLYDSEPSVGAELEALARVDDDHAVSNAGGTNGINGGPAVSPPPELGPSLIMPLPYGSNSIGANNGVYRVSQVNGVNGHAGDTDSDENSV